MGYFLGEGEMVGGGDGDGGRDVGWASEVVQDCWRLAVINL